NHVVATPSHQANTHLPQNNPKLSLNLHRKPLRQSAAAFVLIQTPWTPHLRHQSRTTMDACSFPQPANRKPRIAPPSKTLNWATTEKSLPSLQPTPCDTTEGFSKAIASTKRSTWSMRGYAWWRTKTWRLNGNECQLLGTDVGGTEDRQTAKIEVGVYEKKVVANFETNNGDSNELKTLVRTTFGEDDLENFF
ncbi:hypothetical protein V8G54_032922, partial [Vigna mungo]